MSIPIDSRSNPGARRGETLDAILPAAAMAGHIAVVGMTGSGKSSSGRVVVEYGYTQGEHICIFDTVKSDWHGIVSSFDGDGPGLPFQILGGPYGHVPLHPGAGAQIAELVASGRLPYSIIDTRGFQMGGLQKFFNDFAPVLLDRNQCVLRLVLEEAHELAPKEKSGISGENMGVYHTKKLATAGRSQGLRLMFNTQRVQSLHNAALGSCGTVIVHRMQYPADQEPVVKWLSGTVKDKKEIAAIEASMSELADGEAWVCSGSSRILERRQMPRMWTFDSGATPKQGERQRTPKVTAQVDVEQLRKLIGTAVDVAATNDVDALKAQIAELTKKQVRTGADDSQLYAARNEGFQEGKVAGYRLGFREAVSGARDRITRELAALAGEEDRVASLVTTIAPAQRALATGQTGSNPAPPSGQKPLPPPNPPDHSGVDSSLPKAERMVLMAAAQCQGGGTRSRLALLSGYSITSSTFDNALSGLRAKDFILRGVPVQATPAGVRALGAFKPLPTGVALQQYWLNKLGKAERTLLGCILEEFPRAISREQLGRQSGYSPASSTFDNALSTLRTLELITRGDLKASAELFE